MAFIALGAQAQNIKVLPSPSRGAGASPLYMVVDMDDAIIRSTASGEYINYPIIASIKSVPDSITIDDMERIFRSPTRSVKDTIFIATASHQYHWQYLWRMSYMQKIMIVEKIYREDGQRIISFQKLIFREVPLSPFTKGAVLGVVTGFAIILILISFFLWRIRHHGIPSVFEIE